MRVLQILPDDGVGGAELAARNAASRQGDALHVLSLTFGPPDPPANVRYLWSRHALSPLAALRAVAHARKIKADVVVCSLWKSTPTLVAMRLFLPRVKTVVFLHSDRAVHKLDRWMTQIGVRLAHEVWADSPRSLADRLAETPTHKPRRVISFVLRKLEPTVRDRARPNFIYWGRLQPLKRVDRIIRLFGAVAKDRPDARLTVIGPDMGPGPELRAIATELGVADRVTFVEPETFDQIAERARRADLYLQLSDQEGAAMSVIEAMQLGLVPVVTPVGEMPTYVQHLQTGLIYMEEGQAAADIGRLLDDPALFAAMSAAAVDRWAGAKLYDEDFMDAARALASKGT